MNRIQIGKRWIGEGEACYVVAELSANHNNSLDLAKDIIRAAAEAGADAIKIQTYTAATLTIDSHQQWFQVPGGSLWSGSTLHQLYEQAHTPWEWHGELQRVSHELGLHFFSTPFDDTAVDFLERLAVPAFKVASFELIDVPLLRRIGTAGKPVIVSTGMASLSEIDEAVTTLRDVGTSQIALLKCTSAYPAPPSEMNLKTIPHMAKTFGVVAGLSDHTLGDSVAVAAVALGASIVEKHLTLRRADGGPDSGFSLEPDEFARMVRGIREVEAALGSITYKRTARESENIGFRRSLFAVESIAAGERFTTDNVRSIRPANGLLPKYLPDVLGRTATRDIVRGTPLSWDLVGQSNRSI